MVTVGSVPATTAGLSGAVLASFVLPTALALGVGVLVAAGCCLALRDSTAPLAVGLALYLAFGALALHPTAPPTAAPAVGAAVLLSGLLALVCADVGVRAGTIVDAEGLANTEYDRPWVLPTAVLAFALLSWRVGGGGRALLAAGVAVLLGLHGAIVAGGAAAIHQAATLVPVALVWFVAFPLVSTDAYVSPDESTSPLHRIAVPLGRAPSDRDGGDDTERSPAMSSPESPTDDRSAGEVGAGSTGESPGAAPSAASTGATAGARDATAADRRDLPAAGGSAASGPPGPSPTAGGTASARSDRSDASSARSDGSSVRSDGSSVRSDRSSVRSDASSGARTTDRERRSDREQTSSTGSECSRSRGTAANGDDSGDRSSPSASEWTWPNADEVVTIVGPDVGDDGATSPAGSRRDSSPDHGVGDSAAGTAPTADAADAEATPSGTDDGPDASGACQNCGADVDSCEPRVVGPGDLAVGLCAACQRERADGVCPVGVCRRTAPPLAAADADACQACGATASLEAHAVVPVAGDGYRHPNNVLALCPECHAAVERHRAADG